MWSWCMAAARMRAGMILSLRWWRYNVISVDLPGMSDSGWLQKYDRDIMAEGLMAIRSAGFPANRPLSPFLEIMVSLMCA